MTWQKVREAVNLVYVMKTTYVEKHFFFQARSMTKGVNHAFLYKEFSTEAYCCCKTLGISSKRDMGKLELPQHARELFGPRCHQRLHIRTN
jgi:hypothetical protein